MAEFSGVDNLPSVQILVRGKTGVQAYNGPIVNNDSHRVVLSSVFDGISDLRSSPIFSNDGQILAVLYETKNLTLYNSVSGVAIAEIPLSDVQKVEFSPKGTFLITWSRPTKGNASEEADGNLRVWNVQSGVLVAAYSLKTYKTDSIQWTQDEAYCFRLVTNEVHIFNGLNLNGGIVEKVRHKGLTSFKVSPTSAPHVSIAVFNPDAGGKPAKVSLYQFKGTGQAVEGPLNSRTIFSASEVKFLWNSTGTSLLIHSHSDVDSSNTSYYGATGLYIMYKDVSSKVEQSKDGPIHDVQWSPNGDRFAVAAGAMPSHSTLYDAIGEPVYQFGSAHRNTISFSPHGRFMCLAGFGNLAGEMDFYDTLRLRKLGSNVSHCSTSFSWSPDSRYFMTASLAPRMNVDNGFKVFKYNGTGPVVSQDLERAYDALWRPAAVGVYPNRPPSPKKPSPSDEHEKAAASVEVKAKPAPYRPPGSSGSLSNFMNREAGPAVGKVKKDPLTGATKPTAYVPPTQKQRVIPGMAPAAASQKKPAASGNNNSGAATKAPQPAVKSTPATTTTKTPAPAPVVSAAVLAAEEAADKEKRAKNLRKKLKQLDEIKEKQASGQPLEPEQLKKLETEAALLAELKEIA